MPPPVEPAQDQAFSLTVETQRGAGTLPMDLSLEPVRVMGTAGEIGFLALAFGEDSPEASGIFRTPKPDAERAAFTID